MDSFLNWDSIVGGEQSGAGGGIDAGVESVSGGALEFGNAGGLGTGFVVGLEAGAVDALRPVSDGGLESGSGGALTGVPPKPLTASAVESRVNTAGTTEAVTVSGTSSVSASDLGTASDQDQKTVLASSFISDFADISEAPSVVDDELGLEADGEPGSDSGFDAVSTSGPKDVDAGRGADSAASTPERNGVTDTRALQGGAERSNGAPLTTELRVAPWNEILAESRLGLLEGEQTEKSNETSPAGASSHRPESALMSPEPVILASTEQSGRTQTQERTAAEPLSVQESDVPNPAQNVGHDVAEADVAGLDRSRESDVGPEVEGFTVAEDGWTELTRPESARAEGRIPRQEERDVEILEGEGIMMASVLFEEDAEEGSAAQKAGAGSGKLSWTEGAERECVRAEWFEMEESWVGDAFEKESRLDGEQKGECLEGFSAGDIPAEEAVDEGIPAELGSVSGTLAEGLNILEKMEDGDFTTKQKAPSTGNEVPAEWVRKLWRNWAEGAATGPRPTSAGEDGCSTEATLGPQLRRGVLAERRPVEVECNAPESAEEAESSLESGSTDDHSKRSAETETARAESDTGTKAAGFRPAEKVPAERTRLAEQTRAERIQGDRRWTVVDVPKTEADTATKIRSSETAELPKRKGRSPDSPEERLDPILLLFAQGGTSETILSSSVPIPLTAELLKTERKRTVERGREEPGTTGPEICAAETEQRRSTGVSTGSRASDGVEVLLQGLVAEEDDVSGESGSDSDGEHF